MPRRWRVARSGYEYFGLNRDVGNLAVLRQVKWNPMLANMVEDADARRWSSLWHRKHRICAGLLGERHSLALRASSAHRDGTGCVAAFGAA